MPYALPSAYGMKRQKAKLSYAICAIMRLLGKEWRRGVWEIGDMVEKLELENMIESFVTVCLFVRVFFLWTFYIQLPIQEWITCAKNRRKTTDVIKS